MSADELSLHLPSPAGRGQGWESAAQPRVDASAEHPHPALPLKGEGVKTPGVACG